MSDHCRECMPHDVPKGTTVVCSHKEHHHWLGWSRGPSVKLCSR